MSGTLIRVDDSVEIPADINTLDDFRLWSRSDDFPRGPRIDFVSGHIEVTMVPEDAWFHSAPKSEIVCAIQNLMRKRRVGTVFTDGLRISSVKGNVSAEPDVVLLLHETLKSGRAVLVPSASGERHRYIELEGPPDLVVEIVSDSSVTKDLKRLPPAYFAAGIAEYWLVDVRPKKFSFKIHHRGARKWHAAEVREDGCQYSMILDRWYRLQQQRLPDNVWQYDLIESE